MTFYLIRHGQTSWNEQSRVMGRNETPLDEMGEKQVDQLVESIQNFPIGRIYSSPQLRAQQTAQKLAVSKNIPVQNDDRLSELDFKLWEGKTATELHKDEVYLSRKQNYFTFSHSEVESFESLIRRVGEFISHAEAGSDHVAIVTHADVVRAMIVALMKVPVEMFFRFKVQNASCTVMKKQGDQWVMELLNFTPTPLQGLDI